MGFLVVTALAVVKVKDLFAAVMLAGIYSLLLASLFVVLNAVDVAFTEAAVGAGIATLLMLTTLALTERYESGPSRRSLWALGVVTVTAALLIYGLSDMPTFGSFTAPAHEHVAPRYLSRSVEETGVPNVVTAILVSYRGFDTFGELVVIFTAGVGVLGLLAAGSGAGQSHGADVAEALRRHLILRVVAKMLIPLILIFALYVQFHGDYSPGGGFQAGVIFAAAIILYAMLFGPGSAREVVGRGLLRRLAATGVLLYGAVGVAAFVAGGNFLNYSVLSSDPVKGQHLGILLVELGVGISVASVMILVFLSFSERRSSGNGSQ